MSLDIEFRREALPPLADLEGEWRRLEAAGDPSFFTSWHWIGAWLTALPPASRPALLRGMAQGETVALALLGARVTRRRHGFVRSRGWHLNEAGIAEFDMTIEHNGVLAVRGRSVDAADALVAWFAARGAEADELYLGGTLHRLSKAAVEGRRLGRSEVALPAYRVELDRLALSDGDLTPVLSANARQQLRRAFRRHERDGPLRLNEAATVSEALAFFAAMKTLHCASWERRHKKHSFSVGFFEPFHRLLIERSFPAGVIQLLQVCAGDGPIGYLYNFRLNNRIYAYQSGFSDSDPRDRPGAVTHALAIQHAWRQGMRVYDFMAGHNRLKESFATNVEPMLWQVVQQPRLAFRLEHVARRLKAHLRPLGLLRTS
ncbi:MAG TPA: GNAT family N-acetyltransferase [Stellaceae bacterium]